MYVATAIPPETAPTAKDTAIEPVGRNATIFL